MPSIDEDANSLIYTATITSSSLRLRESRIVAGLILDDGVKVNYGKFGDLLAEVKAVHGKLAEGV